VRTKYNLQRKRERAEIILTILGTVSIVTVYAFIIWLLVK